MKKFITMGAFGALAIIMFGPNAIGLFAAALPAATWGLVMLLGAAFIGGAENVPTVQKVDSMITAKEVRATVHGLLRAVAYVGAILFVAAALVAVGAPAWSGMALAITFMSVGVLAFARRKVNEAMSQRRIERAVATPPQPLQEHDVEEITLKSGSMQPA